MDGSILLCLVVHDEVVYDVGILIARSHTASIVCSTDVDGSALRNFCARISATSYIIVG